MLVLARVVGFLGSDKSLKVRGLPMLSTACRQVSRAFRDSAQRSLGSSLLSGLLLLMALLLCSLPTQAQLYSGTVTGVVTDPTGGVVPGAKVTLVDQNKGYAFTATTDSAGRYLIRSVPPGSYKIKAEAKGFQTEEQSGVAVDVSQIDAPAKPCG